MQTEQLLYWSGITDTEHTSGLNDEEKIMRKHHVEFFEKIA